MDKFGKKVVVTIQLRLLGLFTLGVNGLFLASWIDPLMGKYHLGKITYQCISCLYIYPPYK